MLLTFERMLDTTPRWLSITFSSTSAALLITGIGFDLGLFDPFSITPFTLLLHFIWAIVVSSWILNVRMKLPPEKRTLFAVGIAVVVGSTWSAIQQWMAYLSTGLINDITLVAAAAAMDGLGGLVSYILYHQNILGMRTKVE